MGYFKDLLKGLKQGVIRNADEELIRIELDRRMRNGNRNGDGRASLNIIPEYTPHRSVSLKEWRYAVDLAKSPHNRMRAPLYSVYDRVTIDLELSRLMQKQMEHLQKARFRLVKPNGEEDTEAIKLFETLWWWDYVQYVLEADAYGHSLMELFEMKDKPTAFTVNNRRVMVRELNCVTLVKREHVKPEFGLWVVEETDTEGYSYRSPEMLPYYIEAGGAEDLGYLMKVSPIEIAKRYALGTWSEFNEKIAFPFRWATMPSGNKT